MIALCAEHHSNAGAGAYTNVQFHEFKREAREHAAEIRGRFEWMRRDLLAIVGGNYYYETPVILRFHGENAIWFNRDEDGYHLLNVRMLTTSSEERTRLEDNFWVSRGKPDRLVSPPHGRLLEVRYGNGDTCRWNSSSWNQRPMRTRGIRKPEQKRGGSSSRLPLSKFWSVLAEQRLPEIESNQSFRRALNGGLPTQETWGETDRRFRPAALPERCAGQRVWDVPPIPGGQQVGGSNPSGPDKQRAWSHVPLLYKGVSYHLGAGPHDDWRHNRGWALSLAVSPPRGESFSFSGLSISVLAEAV